MDRFKTAVILAGGKSQRMGFDKQTITVQGRRLIDKMITTLKMEFEEIILISNKPVLYSTSECMVISDEIEDMGPLGGIHTGIKKASSQYVYFTACDMPNLNLEYIRFL